MILGGPGSEVRCEVAGPLVPFTARRTSVHDSIVKLAKRIFLVAGIYGLLVLVPQYFMEKALGRQFPPPLTHPEHFYGFIGVAIAWQCAFLLIARDVQRYRLFMLPAILEKLSFGIPTLILYAQGRVEPLLTCAAMIDLVLATCFVAAYRASGRIAE